jgi:hypothetical protein
MLDAKAYKAHFPDDPAYAGLDRVEAAKTGVLAALAALESEFKTILNKVNHQPR